MQVIRDGIQLCEDCLFAAVNGDVSGIESDERVLAVEAGLEKLGPHLVSDFDSESGKGICEHSVLPCDCCGTKLHGSRHEFAILGEDK
jgi:hypothetical protein